MLLAGIRLPTDHGGFAHKLACAPVGTPPPTLDRQPRKSKPSFSTEGGSPAHGTTNSNPTASHGKRPRHTTPHGIPKTQPSSPATTPASTPPVRSGTPNPPPSPAAPHETAFPCAHCRGVFSARGQLNRHVRRVHNRVRGEACAVCGKRFFSRTDRDRHVSHIHENRRPFRCTVCADAFKTKQHLHGHVAAIHGLSGDGSEGGSRAKVVTNLDDTPRKRR